MNKKFIEEVIKLRDQGEDYEVEKLLEEAITKEPQNTELLLRYALVEMYPPFADFDKSIEAIKQILSYDTKNIKAFLLLAYLQRIRGYTEDELIDQLSAIHSDNNEIQSMIEYAKALYYQANNDIKMYEQFLIKSITLYQKHAWNFISLGELYLKQGKKNEGKPLIQEGLSNVKTKLTQKDLVDYDSTDIDNFLNSQIKGTEITEFHFISMEKDLSL